MQSEQSLQSDQVSVPAYHLDQGKSELYHHHLPCYMERLNHSMDNPPTREKFRLMSTVWFVLQNPISSLWRGFARWERLCAKLFGLDSDEAERRYFQGCEYNILMYDPTSYERQRSHRPNKRGATIFGLLDETKRLIPEPILAHRLACVTVSCMRYLRQYHNNPPIQGDLLAAWAKKSKRLPWLWRQRIRVTSIGRRQPISDSDLPKYSFSLSLRQSHQMLYSQGIQSEDFYQKRHIFYIWTLDLLYHTLRAAMKSDVLTKALSKPFIPSAACILFPLRIKRVQKAVVAYLKKVSRRACSDSGIPTDIYLYVDSSIR